MSQADRLIRAVVEGADPGLVLESKTFTDYMRGLNSILGMGGSWLHRDAGRNSVWQNDGSAYTELMAWLKKEGFKQLTRAVGPSKSYSIDPSRPSISVVVLATRKGSPVTSDPDYVQVTLYDED